ncbi:MAG: flippase [bacterium]
MTKRLSKNLFVLSLGEGLSHLLGFVVNAYIGRILGVDGFGLINYSLAFLTYLLLFNNMGLTTLGTREVARDKNNPTIIGNIVSARLLLTVILYIFFLTSLLLIHGDILTKKLIVLHIITGLPNALYLEFVFQAREEMEFVSLGRITQYASYFVLILLFLKIKEQILAVPLVYLGACSLSTLILIFVYFKKYSELKLCFKPRNLYPTFFRALPIGLATIVYQSAMNFPVIYLKISWGDTEVGFFSAGFKIMIFLLLVEKMIYYLFFPILSKRAKQPDEVLKKSFILFSQIVFGITAFIGIICEIFAFKIITLIYGSHFYQATATFRILVLYFIIAPLNTIWGYGLIALNQEKKFFRVIIITTIANLLLTIVLGNIFKGIGIAFAIFIAEFFGLILMKQSLNAVINFSIIKILNKNEIKTIFTEKA